ncbi:MAG: barstar family protein [Flavobacteriales bacterium]|nr:barstar family protein [Flavobacteriales bacterium]
MQAMDKAFGFPPYFGENWDALWDCMRDMYWINDSEIVLEIKESNLLIGKLKFEMINFFEDLKRHLDKPNNQSVTSKSFDFELVN